jgi:hypothetical protein
VKGRKTPLSMVRDGRLSIPEPSQTYPDYPQSTNRGLASTSITRILLAAAGPFDGLAHEPRRHGVPLVCVVFPGRSGGPGSVIHPSHR